MQIKFLSELIKRLQRAQKVLKKEAPKSAEGKSLSPNLLTPLETKTKKTRKTSRLVLTTNFTVVATAVIFFILLAVNFVLNVRLNGLRDERDDLVTRVQRYSKTEKEIVTIDRLTKIYKTSREEETTVSENVDFVITSLKEIALSGLNFKDGVYTVKTVADSPITYARLISDLFENETIESITIVSVTFERRTENYSAELEINFK